MPRKPKSSTSEAPLTPIPSEILNQFVRQEPLKPEEFDATVRRFKKAIIEPAFGAELGTISAMRQVGSNPTTPPIIAMGAAARLSSRMTARWRSRCHGTETAVSNRG